MNDRVSQKPPTPYLDDDVIRDRYEQEEQIRNRKMAQPRNPISRPDSIAGSEVSKPSSIFRFGKSIAATFNPTNWFGKAKQIQQDDEETAQQKVLRERKQKAEKIYEELKKTGRFRDSDVPPNFQMREEDLTPTKKHDSGIAFQLQASTKMSRDEKRMGMHLPDSFNVYGRDATPGSMVSESAPGSARKSFLNHFKQPSLSNIRKGLGNESGSAPPESGNQARRIPSRKDLQHQQKLVKRVSDLEGKLEAARKKLADARGEPLPPQHDPQNSQAESFITQIQHPLVSGRPRFVPGALSTLYSERHLAGYAPSDDEGITSENDNDDDSISQIGRAVTVDRQVEIAINEPDGTYELEGDTPSVSPLKTNKLLLETPYLPNASPSDHIMESIEGTENFVVKIESEKFEDAVEEEPVKSVREGKAQVEKASDISSSHYTESSVSDYKGDGEKEDGERSSDERIESVTKSPPVRDTFVPKTALPKTGPTKKRKSRSSSERITDNGEIYQPESESESEYSVKRKRSPKKTPTKAPAHRLHKLPKTTTQQTPKVSISKELGHVSATKSQSPRASKSSGKQQRSPVFLKKSGSTVSRSSSKLAKQRRVREPESPPLAPSFSLNYPKPSAKRNSQVGKKVDQPTELYSAAPGGEATVPPMPKMPDAVRLPSGEIISTAGKLSKPRPATERASRAKKGEDKENALFAHESFVWERDTF
jgi:hypothetical protein